MQSIFLKLAGGGAGISFDAVVHPGGDGPRGYQPTTPLPAANASTNWVNSTSTATLATGHGLVTNDVCDLYWAAGKKCQMTATVTGNSVALAGGHGDALPADGTQVKVCKRTALPDLAFVGNNLTAYIVGGDQRVVFDFLDAGGASQATIEVIAPPFPEFWFAGRGTNAFAGKTIASATVSNGGSSAVATPKLALCTNT